ncbi:hypothetical protein [Armatimonas rosea]|uniref:Uncharacterized protein n=1 Tax=Armatimonas rosea TaxID=685828 RepID=A0A7W9W7Q0_ARMRO|nr:hypothetical protein [Armatimonas rosea]MBB6051315.1 hypothetical protein [Armatimonas rosea]
MTPEDALLAYLYPRLVEALQTWKGFDDIYGIWIILALYEDDPAKPSLSHLMPLRHSVATPERIESYFGFPYAPGVADYTVSASLELCADPWPPLNEREHYYDEDGFHDGDPDGLQLREQFFVWRRAQPDYVPISDAGAQMGNPELTSFLEICGTLIRRLHSDGILENLFGQPVPVGISFSNDVNETIALPATRDNNPDRLSKGMEEFMLGKTYEQIEGEAAFRTALRTRPVEEQAQWWFEALRGLRGWMQGKETTTEWEQAQAAGFIGLHPDWNGPVASSLAERLVSQAERHLTILYTPEPSSEQDLAEYLMMEFFGHEGYPEQQQNIDETTIERLYSLLKRLYEESKNEERISSALQLTARALHALRPERFPVVKFGGRRENANRLLEPERFGLV